MKSEPVETKLVDDRPPLELINAQLAAEILKSAREAEELPALQPVPPAVVLASQRSELLESKSVEPTEAQTAEINPEPAPASEKTVEPSTAPLTEVIPTEKKVSEIVEEGSAPNSIPADKVEQPIVLPSDSETEDDFDLSQLIKEHQAAIEFMQPAEPEIVSIASESAEYTVIPEVGFAESTKVDEITDEPWKEILFNQPVEYRNDTWDAYGEIAALWRDQESETEVQFYEFAEEEAVIELRPPLIEAQQDAFAAFLAERPITVETVEPSFTEIQEMAANEEPVGEVLVSLVPLLVKMEDYDEAIDDELPLMQIKQLLCEIHEEVEIIHARAETNPSSPPFTPELTQKLIILLEAVGYENPKAALVDFVAKYDLDFLLQAMEYLYQLTLEENRYEFATASKLPVHTDDSVTTRIGRAIIKLIGIHPEPQPLIV